MDGWGARTPSPRRGCRLAGAGLPIPAILVIALAEWRWPGLIPFPIGAFLHWGLNGTWQEIAGDVWPLFAGGAVVALVSMPLGLDRLRAFAGEIDAIGAAWIPLVLVRTPLLAAWEEVVYRWLLLLAWIPGVVLLNHVLFGFAGFGLVHWLYAHVAGPVADAFTLHRLHFALFGGWGWTVGAAVILANGRFRNAHAYQGWLGVAWRGHGSRAWRSSSSCSATACSPPCWCTPSTTTWCSRWARSRPGS
jgi:hypothetical protein